MDSIFHFFSILGSFLQLRRPSLPCFSKCVAKANHWLCYNCFLLLQLRSLRKWCLWKLEYKRKWTRITCFPYLSDIRTNWWCCNLLLLLWKHWEHFPKTSQYVKILLLDKKVRTFPQNHFSSREIDPYIYLKSFPEHQYYQLIKHQAKLKNHRLE